MEKPQTTFYRNWDNETQTLNGKTLLRLPQKVVDTLEKKQYGIYGHSGVQVCGWTKKALTGKGVCYKTKFYGIDCHSCMEMSPAVMWCQENCSFCWRPMEFMKNIEIDPDKVDEPEEIITNLTTMRSKLLSGFGGNENTNRKFWELSQTPTHYAISLSGEPTMYPHLDKMVAYLKTLKKTKSVFVVTNAQIPEYFEKIEKDPETLPTQLYVSLEAPNKEIFEKVNKSLYSDGWERLHKSLEIFSRLNTRKVIRMTLIKNLNDKDEYLKKYAEQIHLSNTDFIEIKGYVHIGMSNKRHKKEDMPTFEEIENFTKKLEEELGDYEYAGEAINSRITLLKKKDSKYKIRIHKFENQ